MRTRKKCLDCGAHAFERRCGVCGSERLEDVGPRFDSSPSPKEPTGAVAVHSDPDLAADDSSPDR